MKLNLQKKTNIQEANVVVYHEVDDILQQDENKKLSAKSKTQQYQNIDSEVDKKELYELDNSSLNESNRQ